MSLRYLFFVLVVLVILCDSCTEENYPVEEGPTITCTEHEDVSGWIQDTLITGYKFNYPPYLIKGENKGIFKVYKNNGMPDDRITLWFGTCGGAIDPCEPEPYSKAYQITPPSGDTIMLRFTESVKTIEVCNNETLHGVLYLRFHHEEFDSYNGMFFTMIEEEEKFYLGGDFYFDGRYLDDVIKICRSFVPIE